MYGQQVWCRLKAYMMPTLYLPITLCAPLTPRTRLPDMPYPSRRCPKNQTSLSLSSDTVHPTIISALSDHVRRHKLTQHSYRPTFLTTKIPNPASCHSTHACTFRPPSLRGFPSTFLPMAMSTLSPASRLLPDPEILLYVKDWQCTVSYATRAWRRGPLSTRMETT